MANIGYLTSFAEFIDKYKVEIPRIQRDYTYGSKTEKTEMVLNKLLQDIHDALANGTELILDFVYGSKEEAFQPLDGQQRLTTLYLIYYYAAINAGKKVDKSFKYATRDDSTIFCETLLDFKYERGGAALVDQIKDDAFYRPSFNDDPSIRSILVVLERIEQTFDDMVTDADPSDLWKRITVECPVKFYCLDFDKFSLSDDLYIKMNSRGKQLTEYEIFKSQFEKYIEVSLEDKDLKYQTASRFDTEYTDLVWKKLGNVKTAIDSVFVNLFKNLFLILNYKFRSGKIEFDWRKPLSDGMSLLSLTKQDVEFINDFIGTFRDIQKSDPNFLSDNFYKDDTNVLPHQAGKIRFFKSDVDAFAAACKNVLKNPQLVSLYAEYQTIKRRLAGANWQDGARHIRNLIEFSDDELGHSERLSDMFAEIDLIIVGNIRSIDAKTSMFNTVQFEEELEKEANKSAWLQLFEYENHDILRGSLSRFSHPNGFSLSEPAAIKSLLDRLGKFAFVFDDNAKTEDQNIRACLLSIGDFSQQHNMQYDSKMVGCQYGSWRQMFTVSSYFKDKGVRIMDVIAQVNTSNAMSILPLSGDDWRYYATDKKYYKYTYLSYGAPKYGYYYFQDPNKSLEVYLLQSPSFGSDNVMWKLLNNLLWHNLPQGLDVHFNKYQEDHTVVLNNELSIDAMQDGWQIEDRSANQTYMQWLRQNTSIQAGGLIPYVKGQDHIVEMVSLLNRMVADKVLAVKESEEA